MKTLPLFAAGWEPFIPFLIFFGFLALSVLQSIRKRNQRSEDDWDRPIEIPEGDTDSEGRTIVGRYVRPNELPPAQHGQFSPPPPVASEPRPLSPWEQELERILRRNEPAPMPAYPEEPTLPAPPPLIAERPSHRQTTVEELVARDLESAPMPSNPLASLSRADHIYSEAANLAERARHFIQGVDAKVANAAPTVPASRRARSPELEAFLAGLKRPAPARQAIIASVILGRPKALEM